MATIMGFGLSGWLEGYVGAALSSTLLREGGTLSVALIALDAAVVVTTALACRATLVRRKFHPRSTVGASACSEPVACSTGVPNHLRLEALAIE